MTLPNSLVKLFTYRPWTELRPADFNTLRLEQVVTISSLPWTFHPSFYSPALGISSKLLTIRKKIKYQSLQIHEKRLSIWRDWYLIFFLMVKYQSLQMLSLFSCISDGRCKYSNKHSLKDINVSISNVTLVYMSICRLVLPCDHSRIYHKLHPSVSCTWSQEAIRLFFCSFGFY